MISYELAAKLKGAGFPQFHNDRHWFYSDHTQPSTLWCLNALNNAIEIPAHEKDAHQLYAAPTLAELIEECGDDFYTLRHGRVWIATAEQINTASRNGVDSISETGLSPEEAVARLWLTLHESRPVN